MNAPDLRALAQRCRELYRVAVKPEVKAQLLEWIDDFESEAAAAETQGESTRPYAQLSRNGGSR